MKLKASLSTLFMTVVLMLTTMATNVHAQQIMKEEQHVTGDAQRVMGFVESYNMVGEEGVTPQLNVYVRGPLKGKLGWSLWTQTAEMWSEGYVGLVYTPAKWIEVSSGIGLETDESPFRTGHSLWLGNGRWSFMSVNEYGGSGYWYNHLGMFQATKTICIGVDSIRFIGTGPYVEKRFNNNLITFWGTYAIGDNMGVIGAKFNF